MTTESREGLHPMQAMQPWISTRFPSTARLRCCCACSWRRSCRAGVCARNAASRIASCVLAPRSTMRNNGESFQRVAALAERTVYGSRDVPAEEVEPIVAAARDARRTAARSNGVKDRLITLVPRGWRARGLLRGVGAEAGHAAGARDAPAQHRSRPERLSRSAALARERRNSGRFAARALWRAGDDRARRSRRAIC